MMFMTSVYDSDGYGSNTSDAKRFINIWREEIAGAGLRANGTLTAAATSAAWQRSMNHDVSKRRWHA
jgi:hypothetical protein